MHKELESWVTLPCHIHLGGVLKMIMIEYMHSSPSKVKDHIEIKSKTHSLSKPMIYTYFFPFGNKLPKSLKMHSAIRHSGLVFGRWCR